MKAINTKSIRMIFMVLLFKQLPILYAHAQPLDQSSLHQVAQSVKISSETAKNIYAKSISDKSRSASIDYPLKIENSDTLFICYKGKDYLYQDGQIYLDGKLHTGKTKGFLRQTVNALSKINEGEEGAGMITELDQSANTFVITDGYGHFKTNNVCKAYANQIKTDTGQSGILQSVNRTNTDIEGGSGGMIYWAPAGTVLPTLHGGIANATLDLAHDMFHGLDANRGLLDNRLHNGLARSEWQTVFRENILRAQLNLPLRTHYSWNVDELGNFVKGNGRSMITGSNQPINPWWYKL